MLEHSPHKSLTPLAQQAQVLMTTAWSATTVLCLLRCEVRHVQVIEDGNYEGMHFCDWVLQAVYDDVFHPKLIFYY
jgi:hypothetical protein